MKEDIKKAIEVLKRGGTLLYPSDTIWGIGCDAGNDKAAQKIHKIKGRHKKSSFIVLLHDVNLITDYVEEVPQILEDLISSFDFPTTIIYPRAKNLAKNVIAVDGSIAIRIVRKGFIYDLLSSYGKPIVSTSANYSGEPTPVMFKDISESLVKHIDYVVKSDRTDLKEVRPSTIIRIKPNGEFDIIRE